MPPANDTAAELAALRAAVRSFCQSEEHMAEMALKAVEGGQHLSRVMRSPAYTAAADQQDAAYHEMRELVGIRRPPRRGK